MYMFSDLKNCRTEFPLFMGGNRRSWVAENYNKTITLTLMPTYPAFDVYQPCLTYTPPGRSKIGDYYNVSFL